MKTYAETLAEDRRLVILKLLEQAPDYRGNIYLLQSALEGFGHSIGLNVLREDLVWLEQQLLVTLHPVGEVLLAELSGRGLDAALGRISVPGVKRPAPRA